MKPVVRFMGEALFYESPHGEYARVHTIDHPRLGCDKVRTSLIVKKFSDGSFETLNTIYRPEKELNVES